MMCYNLFIERSRTNNGHAKQLRLSFGEEKIIHPQRPPTRNGLPSDENAHGNPFGLVHQFQRPLVPEADPKINHVKGLIQEIAELEEMNRQNIQPDFRKLDRLIRELDRMNVLDDHMIVRFSKPWDTMNYQEEEPVPLWQIFIADLGFLREDILPKLISGEAHDGQEALEQRRESINNKVNLTIEIARRKGIKTIEDILN